VGPAHHFAIRLARVKPRPGATEGCSVMCFTATCFYAGGDEEASDPREQELVWFMKKREYGFVFTIPLLNHSNRGQIRKSTRSPFLILFPCLCSFRSKPFSFYLSPFQVKGITPFTHSRTLRSLRRDLTIEICSLLFSPSPSHLFRSSLLPLLFFASLFLSSHHIL